MEAYILDNRLRRVEVVDLYDSFVWSERFSSLGDFELVVEATPTNRRLFKEGAFITHNNTKRFGEITTIEDGDSSEGQTMMTVTGKSAEKFLDDRMAMSVIDGTLLSPSWDITGKPAAIARKVFKDICVTGILDVGDIIPLINPLSISSNNALITQSTITEPPDDISVEITPKSVLQAITEICDSYGLGFRLLRAFDTSKLYFDIYAGVDRTSKQDNYKAVVFSHDLENLTSTSRLSSISDYKNVAYVTSKHGAKVVYPVGTAASISGFNRKVLYVKHDTEIQDGPELQSMLEQKGQEELALHRRSVAYDGEISQYSQYKYGVDYELGDLVEMRADDGTTTNMRVTEQIFSSDSSGEKSYPTLAIDMFIVSGTWLTWDYDQIWPEAIGGWSTA